MILMCVRFVHLIRLFMLIVLLLAFRKLSDIFIRFNFGMMGNSRSDNIPNCRIRDVKLVSFVRGCRFGANNSRRCRCLRDWGRAA